ERTCPWLERYGVDGEIRRQVVERIVERAFSIVVEERCARAAVPVADFPGRPGEADRAVRPAGRRAPVAAWLLSACDRAGREHGRGEQRRAPRPDAVRVAHATPRTQAGHAGQSRS